MSDRYGYTRARGSVRFVKKPVGVAGWRAPKAGEWRRRRRREGWGRLGDLGERRELPQRGPGRCPARKTNFMHFKLHNALFWWIDNLIFTTLWSVKIFKK